MIKHFCDVCGEEVEGISRVSNVTLLSGLIDAQFYTDPLHDTDCELCIKCANTIIKTVEMMKKGKGVTYVEKKQS